MKKTVMVVGLGSMGRRRIRLLQMYQSDIHIVGIDTNENRCVNVEREFHIKTYQSVENIFLCEHIFSAFISTAPLYHAEIIRECLRANIHVFSELNLVEYLYKENMELAKEKGKVLFLSSTFLYRKETQYIKEEVKKSKKNVNYIYHAGQYLPDWHPWESYKNFFVGRKETNGCREFMAIEFPWLIDTFGKVKDVKSFNSKISELEIDYSDNYTIIFEHENGNKGVIALDIVSRKAVRNLEVFGENIYITWNGTPESLNKYDFQNKNDEQIMLYEKVDKCEGYSASVIEDAYYSEIAEFFDIIENGKEARYTFEDDLEILKLIDKIEGNGGEKNDTE